MVQANLNDVDALKAALQGCYGVFLVTAFWPSAADGGRNADEPLSGNNEKQQALNAIEACKAAGVQHLVYSSLEDTRLVDDWSKATDLAEFGRHDCVLRYFGKFCRLISHPDFLENFAVLVAWVWGGNGW